MTWFMSVVLNERNACSTGIPQLVGARFLWWIMSDGIQFLLLMLARTPAVVFAGQFWWTLVLFLCRCLFSEQDVTRNRVYWHLYTGLFSLFFFFLFVRWLLIQERYVHQYWNLTKVSARFYSKLGWSCRNQLVVHSTNERRIASIHILLMSLWRHNSYPGFWVFFGGTTTSSVRRACMTWVVRERADASVVRTAGLGPEVISRRRYQRRTHQPNERAATLAR